jgi:phosphoglycolate phosphatase
VSTAEEAVDYLFQCSPLKSKAHAYREAIDYRPFVPLMRMEPHLLEVLRSLRRSSYWTAIATNRALSMPSVLRVHKLEGVFDLTVTALDVTRPKPHPECLWKILNYFKVGPDEAIYIGDAETDRLVAQRASVPFAAYKNPKLNADYHIRDHRELLEMFHLTPEKT